MSRMANPLLTDAPLPRFQSIEPAHAEPAIRQLLEANRRELQQLLESGASGWDGIVVPLERMHHRLARAWSPVGHLNGVMNGDETGIDCGLGCSQCPRYTHSPGN